MVSVFDLKPRARRAESSRSPGRSRVVRIRFTKRNADGLDGWGIDAGVAVGEFSREQSAYLDYHRGNVFKSSLLES